MNSTFTDTSPELLRAVVDHSLTSIYAARAIRDTHTGELIDFQIYFCNPAFCRRVGLSQTDLQTHTLRTLFPVLIETGFYDQYRQVVDTGASFEGEQEYPGPNGRFWYQTTVKKLDDGIVVNFIDITDRKQIEEQIRQQALLLDSVLDTSPSSIITLDVIREPETAIHSGEPLDFRYVLVNAATARTMDKPKEAIIGRTLFELFPGARQADFLAHWRKALDTGEPQRYETYFNQAGVEGWFEVTVALVGDRLMANSVNTTELRRAVRDQKQQAELLRSVLDGSQNAIIAFDAMRNEQGQIIDFRYVLQNEANRQRVGRPDAILLGRTLLEFYPEVATNGLLEQYAQVVETGLPLRFEQAFTYRTDGPHRPTDPNVPGWYDYSVVKRGDGIVLTVHDKTGERRARQQTEQVNRELLRSNESLQNFAYVASHDLQEPLRKIQAFGNIVMERFGSSLPAEGQDMLRRMQTAADRMSTLIRDLLALSRLSTQQQPFRLVNLNQLLTGILSDLELVIGQTGARIDMAQLPAVWGDGVQLGQLFQNLLTNALKFQLPMTTPHVQIDCRRISPDNAPPGLLSFKKIGNTSPGGGAAPPVLCHHRSRQRHRLRCRQVWRTRIRGIPAAARQEPVPRHRGRFGHCQESSRQPRGWHSS